MGFSVVIFNWRDLPHPRAGGAEVVTHVLAAGLAARGHQVICFTSRHNGAPMREERDGYAVERHGNEITCRLHAFAWLRARARSFDVVIDEVNTLPFLSRFATGRPVVLWLHQIAREVWLAEAPPVIGRVGYALEPMLLALYRGLPIITGSQSSAQSFACVGLTAPARIAQYPLAPPEPARATPRFARIGYVGRITPSKRIDHIIRALAIVRVSVPEAELLIIGGGAERERRRLVALAQRLGVAEIVTFAGRVSEPRRDELIRSCDVLAMTSLREGWGLVVSEAARFRVPSVVYPVAGLIDSVDHGVTGLVAAAPDPGALAADLVRVIGDRALRERLGTAASERLRPFSAQRFVADFERILGEFAAR